MKRQTTDGENISNHIYDKRLETTSPSCKELSKINGKKTNNQVKKLDKTLNTSLQRMSRTQIST